MKLELNLAEDKELILKICNAVGSEKRIEILDLIRRYPDINYQSIASEIKRAPGTLTPQMKTLKNVGIIKENILAGKRGAVSKIAEIVLDEIVIRLK